MADLVRDFYDELAGDYHLIFEDWEASMARQGAALRKILERECGPTRPVSCLDCSCGIGTQALALARLGFRVTGSDVSARAIERARNEAHARGLDARFYQADMRHLAEVPGADFDAVISMDNALPHLLSVEDLGLAAANVRAKLRNGGVFVASIRDYDRLIEEHPAIQGPGFLSDAGRRRIVFQLWDWMDERLYTFHLYITRETATGWETHHGASIYRAIRREELTQVLERAGFVNVRWLEPAESGFYQPVVLGTFYADPTAPP